MLGLNLVGKARLRTLMRGIPTLCGVVAVLMLVTGCPPATTPCADDTACDDGLFCNGAETCDIAEGAAEGVCVDGTPPCMEGETCDEELDICYTVCETADDCDDADLCTEDDCVDGVCENIAIECDDDDLCTTDECVDGECVFTDVVCDEGYECDPDTGECVLVDLCLDVVCDDEDACTTDECDPETGECVYTEIVCDEGFTCVDGDCIEDACVGVECDDDDLCTTDECVAGECVYTDVVCAEGEECDADTGECVEVTTVECETDDDCADLNNDLYCDGVWTCDTDTGLCVDSGDPCVDTDCGDDDPICEEGDTAAECSCPAVPTLDFTLGSDELTGTTGDDTFAADLEFSPGAGRQISQLQTGDSANGLAGADILNAKVNGTGAADGTSTPTLDGIETLNFSVFDYNQTINCTNIAGAEAINSVNSTNQLILTALANNVAIGSNGSSAAAATDIVNATFVTAVTSGSDETIAVALDGGVTGGDITVATGGASGFETVAFSSSGTDANTLSEFVNADASLVKATFAGSGPLAMELIPDAILTIDASGMSGNLTLGDGTMADPGGTDPYDTFATGGTVAYKDFTGGTGDDLFIFQGSLLTTDFDGSGEELDGGDGTDTVQASIGTSIGIAISMPNVEEIRTNATGNGLSWKLDAPQLATITIEQDAATNTAFEIKGIPGTPDLVFRGDGEAAGADMPFDGITYTSSSASGTSDTLNININNRGVAVNTTTATSWVMSLGPLSILKMETINLTVEDGHATITTGITATGAGAEATWTIVASNNLTLGIVDSDAKEQNSVDATGVLGDFSATFQDLNDSASVTLGVGDDTFSAAGSTGDGISIDAGAGDDTITGSGQDDDIDGGAGDDTITGGAGADTLTGGSGKDTFVFSTIILAANANTIADMESGANKDKIRIDATTFTDYAAATDVTFAAGGAGAAALTVAVDSVIIRDTNANILLTTPAAGAQAVMAIATDTGNIFYDANGNFTAGAVIIGTMPVAKVAGLVASNFVTVP